MSRLPLPASGTHAQSDLAEGARQNRSAGYLRGGAAVRDRIPPPPNRIARRRLLINLAKWSLPMAAILLLGLIALWPEVQRIVGQTRLNMAHISGEIEGGKLIDARYNGVDEKGRPYTVTAATAWQIDPERVGLTMPKGDITLENGTWLMLTSKEGTYLQHRNQLDLVKDVTLYRDDGTTMHTASASIDIKAGAAAGSEPTHAEGPFGVLDAEGFTVMDNGTAIDFPGPAHLVLNGVNH